MKMNLLKEIMQEELEGLVPEVCVELGISIPNIVVTEDCDKLLGACGLLVQKQLLTVIDVTFEGTVRIHLGSIEKMVNNLFGCFTTRKKKARMIRALIQHTLCHELRHVWQTLHMKNELCENHSPLSISHLFSGENKTETDAEEFAFRYMASRPDAHINFIGLLKTLREVENSCGTKSFAALQTVSKTELIKLQLKILKCGFKSAWL